jgi:hypothetical protein
MWRSDKNAPRSGNKHLPSSNEMFLRVKDDRAASGAKTYFRELTTRWSPLVRPVPVAEEIMTAEAMANLPPFVQDYLKQKAARPAAPKLFFRTNVVTRRKQP